MLRLSVVVVVAAACANAQLTSRPMNLPKMRAGAECPVSKGSHDIVPNPSNIFCAECLWFGTSPVNFAWAYGFKSSGGNAVFDLVGVQRYHSGYAAKTPWVARYDFSGPILIRGRQIDGNGKLRFSAAGPKLQDKFALVAPNRGADSEWSFWPAEMSIPHAGCYAIQIDTLIGSEVVVFEADAGK